MIFYIGKHEQVHAEAARLEVNERGDDEAKANDLNQ
jgi:hypothetical protein